MPTYLLCLVIDSCEELYCSRRMIYALCINLCIFVMSYDITANAVISSFFFLSTCLTVVCEFQSFIDRRVRAWLWPTCYDVMMII